MDENASKTTSRRSLIKGAALLAGVVIVPLLATGGKAFGADKLTKASVKYQDKAKEGKDCDDCIQFIPGETTKDMGTCKVVEGAISPHSYCLAFTPKPKRV
jgi:hypothetical protein